MKESKFIHEENLQVLSALEKIGSDKYNNYKEKFLIKEAKKRGFKDGNFKCLIQHTCNNGKGYIYNGGNLYLNGQCLFSKYSKWAKIIIETITKEQAEKELGKTIID